MDFENPTKKPEPQNNQEDPGGRFEGINTTEGNETYRIKEEGADPDALKEEEAKARQEQTNEEFLGDHPELKQMIDEYEKQLGEDFSQHKDEIVETLKNSAPGKGQDELKVELTELIRQKLNPTS